MSLSIYKVCYLPTITFLPSPSKNLQRMQYVFIYAICQPSVRPLSVRPLTPISSDAKTSYSMLWNDLNETGTHIQQVSGHCWKGFQGQRSKVKVMTRLNTIMARRHAFRRCGVEAHLFPQKFYCQHLIASPEVQTSSHYKEGRVCCKYCVAMVVLCCVQARGSIVRRSGSATASTTRNRQPSGRQASCCMTCCVETYRSTTTTRSSTHALSIGDRYPPVCVCPSTVTLPSCSATDLKSTSHRNLTHISHIYTLNINKVIPQDLLELSPITAPGPIKVSTEIPDNGVSCS